MTTVAPTPPALAEPLSLTDKARKAGLIHLARNADWQTYAEVTSALAILAHPSLSPGRRADLFESYREHIERVAALRAGVADWTEFFDEGDFRNSCDAHQVAAELLGDRADELLFALINGEK